MRDLRRHPDRGDPLVCNIAAAAIVGGASLASAAIGAGAASSAAGAQSAAAEHSADIQKQMYDTTRGDLLPYNRAGQIANSDIASMGPFAFAPTEAQLQTTPGYQFTLNQGLKSVQNAAAARGLGISGAALKGASSYATGLADTTYQDNFNRALTQYTTNLGKLQNQQTLGENAAAQTGAQGTAAAANIGQSLIGAANARAAGTVGVANAISGGIQGAGNAYLTGQFLSGQNAGMYANAYGASPGAIAEPVDQFGFGAAGAGAGAGAADYSGLFAYGS